MNFTGNRKWSSLDFSLSGSKGFAYEGVLFQYRYLKTEKHPVRLRIFKYNVTCSGSVGPSARQATFETTSRSYSKAKFLPLSTIPTFASGNANVPPAEMFNLSGRIYLLYRLLNKLCQYMHKIFATEPQTNKH